MNFNVIHSEEVLEKIEADDGFLDAQMGFHPSSDDDLECELLESSPLFDPSSLVAPDGQEWSTQKISKQEPASETCDQAFRFRPATRKEAFGAIFHEILDLVVAATNPQARRLFDNWKITTKEEISAFLGLFAIAGVFKGQHRNIREFWDDRDGHPLFPATMSFGRFAKLRAALTFDDARGRASEDKLAPVRAVLEHFNENLRGLYEPGPSLIVGRMFEEFHGRVAWQEISERPGRLGLKFFWIADVSNAMPLQCALSTGNDRTFDQESYVMQLSKHYLSKGRTIALDKELTSIKICRQLLVKDTAVVGVVRSTSRDIPSIALSTGDRMKGDTKWFHSRDVVLCSHWRQGAKPTLLLSTKASLESREGPPELVHFHDAASAAMAQFNDSVREFSSRRSCTTWPASVFFLLFDAAVVAAHKLGSAQEELYSFKKELAYELCEPLIKRRLTLPLLRSGTKDYIHRAFPSSREQPPQGRQYVSSANQGRCAFCPRVTDRKTRKRCAKCKKFICGTHQHIQCPTCFK